MMKLRKRESFLEENSGEDGLLADAMNDKEKVTATSVKARLKVTTDKEEKAGLRIAQVLFDAETKAKKRIKKHRNDWILRYLLIIQSSMIMTLKFCWYMINGRPVWLVP